MAAYSTDLDFQEAARYVHEGSWKAAIKILEQMLTENPEHRSSILPLLADARMKAGISTKGTQGRSPLSLLITRKRITYALIALVVIVVGIGSRGVYNRVVLPAREQQLQRSLIDGLFEQARTALSGSDYVVAAELFGQVLEKKPDSPDAAKGYTEAQRQIELAASYDSALSALSRGETETALETLQSILATAPGYRDVEKQIDLIRTQGKLGELFVQAEGHHQAERWAEAIPLFVEIRQSHRCQLRLM